MRVLDLFSGIGGFSLGLERAGMRTVGFCEIEPYARAVLAKHWPDVPCDHDITKREFVEGEADVICGGFPCQDISQAGAGAGLAGERSGLWRELLRAIRVVRPKYAVVENVAALLGRGLGTVLGDMAEIGYDAEWNCIPASAVGAPHIRDRIWILGYAQHSNANEQRSYRAPIDIDGDIELRDEQVGEFGSVREALADTGCLAAQIPIAGELAAKQVTQCDGWWSVEPDVGRVAHGVPNRVDRLKGLGNAVVPQISEIIGRAIMSAEKVR